VQSTISPYVLVDARSSPFARAEEVKHNFMTRLDALLSEFERELTAALNVDSLSPTYQLAELGGYISRAGQALRHREQLAIDRAAQAEQAERSQAWVNATPTKTN